MCGIFLRNDLAEGRYIACGRPVVLSAPGVPTFSVETETDQVAPWCSVYKLRLVSAVETAFLLKSGGHNAGVVS